MSAQKSQQNGALARLQGRSQQQQTQNAGKSGFVEIPVNKLVFDPKQPRQAFHAADGIVAASDQEELEILAASIKKNGLIHPITVCELPDGNYLVRVGERRSRATILNGDEKILARIRNDLQGVSVRALQLVENTDRQDLTDRDIATSIKDFLTKSDENPEPLSKGEVATLLQKSSGWVTRYIVYGDQINQDKWVLPGYVASPETLYLLTLLPEHIQNIAYADLSTGKTESPLKTKGLKYYQEIAKREKESAVKAQASPANSSHTDDWPFTPPAQNAAVPPLDTDARVNLIAAAMGGKEVSNTDNTGQAIDVNVKTTDSTGSYQMPADLVNDLRRPTFSAPQSGGSGEHGTHLKTTPSMMVNSAVNCKLSLGALAKVVEMYGGELEGMSKVEAEIRVTTSMALELLKLLTGQNASVEQAPVLLNKALANLK